MNRLLLIVALLLSAPVRAGTDDSLGQNVGAPPRSTSGSPYRTADLASLFEAWASLKYGTPEAATDWDQRLLDTLEVLRANPADNPANPRAADLLARGQPWVPLPATPRDRGATGEVPELRESASGDLDDPGVRILALARAYAAATWGLGRGVSATLHPQRDDLVLRVLGAPSGEAVAQALEAAAWSGAPIRPPLVTLVLPGGHEIRLPVPVHHAPSSLRLSTSESLTLEETRDLIEVWGLLKYNTPGLALDWDRRLLEALVAPRRLRPPAEPQWISSPPLYRSAIGALLDELPDVATGGSASGACALDRRAAAPIHEYYPPLRWLCSREVDDVGLPLRALVARLPAAHFSEPRGFAESAEGDLRDPHTRVLALARAYNAALYTGGRVPQLDAALPQVLAAPSGEAVAEILESMLWQGVPDPRIVRDSPPGTIPVVARFVDRELVVAAAAEGSALQPGDVVESIDGARLSGSYRAFRDPETARVHLLAGPVGSTAKILVNRRFHLVTVEEERVPAEVASPYRLPAIGSVDDAVRRVVIGALPSGAGAAAARELRGARRLIVDLRWTAEPEEAEAFTEVLLAGADRGRRRGVWVVVIDESTSSSLAPVVRRLAEHATLVGTELRADDASHEIRFAALTLPGGRSISLPLAAPSAATLRADVPVPRSVAALRDGRDITLERAHEVACQAAPRSR